MRQPIQPQKNFHLLFLTSVAVRFQSGGMIQIVEFKADFRNCSLDIKVEKKAIYDQKNLHLRTCGSHTSIRTDPIICSVGIFFLNLLPIYNLVRELQ